MYCGTFSTAYCTLSTRSIKEGRNTAPIIARFLPRSFHY
nr:MAG TPA: hypothetical protein [Caudoviricetes sp.]